MRKQGLKGGSMPNFWTELCDYVNCKIDGAHFGMLNLEELNGQKTMKSPEGVINCHLPPTIPSSADGHVQTMGPKGPKSNGVSRYQNIFNTIRIDIYIYIYT